MAIHVRLVLFLVLCYACNKNFSSWLSWNKYTYIYIAYIHGRKVLRFVMKERGARSSDEYFLHYYLYLIYLLLAL